jgi:hypothetical protein
MGNGVRVSEKSSPAPKKSVATKKTTTATTKPTKDAPPQAFAKKEKRAPVTRVHPAPKTSASARQAPNDAQPVNGAFVLETPNHKKNNVATGQTTTVTTR